MPVPAGPQRDIDVLLPKPNLAYEIVVALQFLAGKFSWQYSIGMNSAATLRQASTDSSAAELPHFETTQKTSDHSPELATDVAESLEDLAEHLEILVAVPLAAEIGSNVKDLVDLD
mmetsp:Transcript_36093/g.81247  ORF Transcript_36093/g.81247 Transcript_36093/m.81247 type:complete len:116 (-) Transcript_36093:569-916(-)